MRRKGIFTLLMAAFMVLAFSAVTLAANNVRLTTTVPNIPKSTCYQAGTDTFEFDTLTAIGEGDVMQITLNNKVTLCKALDMFVTVNAGGAATSLEISADAPIATTAGTISAAGGTGQWGFLVKGSIGSQIITVQLRKRDTVTFAMAPIGAGVMSFYGNVAADKLLLKLFDGKFGFGASLIYSPAGVVYNTALTAVTGPITNIICIDTLTLDFPDEYVQNTPDSIPIFPINKLFYSGDYRIAHIMTAQTFELETCKGATCGNIPFGTSGQASTCAAFDYETLGGAGLPYCSNHTASAGYLPKFILKSSQAFDLVPYIVTMEILVNGLTGERGVYWSSTPPLYGRSATTTCGAAVAATGFAGQSYLRGDGISAAVPVPPIAGNCAGVAAGAKAVKITTTSGLIFSAGDQFFELNLPPFNYNLAEVAAGDVVSVRVTFTKGTCGTVTKDLCIGTFIATCPASASTGSCLVPFVSSLAAGDTYWNGLAVINTSSLAGSVNLTAYKKDGTTATATIAVPANGMYSNMVSSIPWVGTAPAGVPAYIMVQSTNYSGANLDAFVMMADGTHNSMGYTCRKPAAAVGSY